MADPPIRDRSVIVVPAENEATTDYRIVCFESISDSVFAEMAFRALSPTQIDVSLACRRRGLNCGRHDRPPGDVRCKERSRADYQFTIDLVTIRILFLSLLAFCS